MNSMELTIRPIDLHARATNIAHRDVKSCGRKMLAAAEMAGLNLIEAKKLLPHGDFKLWVAAYCECSYAQAVKYMRVARRLTKSGPQATFEGGINAFLDATAETRKPTPKSPTFDTTDATHAQKLHALATRGATEGERDAAQRKLDTFAGTFGMTGEEAAGEAEIIIDHAENMTRVEKGLDRFADTLRAKDKDYLIKVIMACLVAHPDLIDKVL